MITLREFILQEERKKAGSTGELTAILNDIVLASKIISKETNKAGLTDILGTQGAVNVQGENQMKLDVIADETFIKVFKDGGEICAIGSEENDDYVVFETPTSQKGKYVVLFDPLDGSSNIDVNVSIGTIFSIFKRKSSPEQGVNIRDLLQAGNELVAAGYVLYGSSTMLVYSTGEGVNGFTLEPSLGEYCLSHPNMMFPENGTIYSVNEGNLDQCDSGVVDYVKYCRSTEDGKKPYSGRYIGSLVADFHRNLIKGGIYIYPGTTSAPNGKLRLLYECAPLGFIAEQAGGLATSGKERILDIIPNELHQRTPYIVGSKNMVKKLLSYL